MKRKTLILTLMNLIFFTTSIQAQNPTFDWAKQMGGYRTSGLGFSLTTDKMGNVYSIGEFQATIDIDPGPGVINFTSLGNNDTYIQKLDAKGNLLWAKHIGGTNKVKGYSITSDNNGNIYTTGEFQGTVDFDPDTGVTNLVSASSPNTFIQKLDSNGNFIWAKQINGTNWNIGYSITVDASENLLIIGRFTYTADFDPGTSTVNLTASGPYSDIFTLKLDNNGSFIWARQTGGTQSDYGTFITTDAQNNVYTTGHFEGTADFDPGSSTMNLISVGDYDVYIQKLDSNGIFKWAKQIGGIDDDKGNSITTDANGNVYTTGYFQFTADFDPGISTTNLTAMGEDDIFIQKLDTDGNYIWAKQIGGTDDDRGNSIKTDANSNLYITGTFEDTVDFDPGLGNTNTISIKYSDIYILKLDSNGKYIWVNQIGGIGNGSSQSIDIDANGSIYGTGSFNGILDFDPGVGVSNLTPIGYQDIFVYKLTICSPTSSTDVITACDSFKWIDGITYKASNSTAMDTLTNAGGCDSIITLNLTINKVSDLSTSVTASTITANNSDGTYVWLDCDNNYSLLPGETKQTFTPTRNGLYAVELTENACVDTSACVAVYPVGITHLLLTDNFDVYPNPTDGKFTIQFKSPQESIIIRILSPEGQEIESKKFQNTKRIQMVLNQTTGFYFLEVIDEQNNRKVIKLIKT